MHVLQSLIPVIATVKSWALLMASVGKSVSTNKRKEDDQRELREEAGKVKKKKCSFIQVLGLYGAEENSRWTNFQQSCCINEIAPVHTSLKRI